MFTLGNVLSLLCCFSVFLRSAPLFKRITCQAYLAFDWLPLLAARNSNISHAGLQRQMSYVDQQ